MKKDTSSDNYQNGRVWSWWAKNIKRLMSTWREFLGKKTEFTDNQFVYHHTTGEWRSQNSNPTLPDSKARVPFIME